MQTASEVATEGAGSRPSVGDRIVASMLYSLATIGLLTLAIGLVIICVTCGGGTGGRACHDWCRLRGIRGRTCCAKVVY